jgi:hypothetical protein
MGSGRASGAGYLESPPPHPAKSPAYLRADSTRLMVGGGQSMCFRATRVKKGSKVADNATSSKT